MKKDFITFQEEFKRYQSLLGLSGYKVYFKYEPLDSSFAEISINQVEMVATVRLNSNLPDKDKPHKDIKCTAKHEALHLLVGRLELYGRCRYVSENEIHEATEELVIRLEGLVQ